MKSRVNIRSLDFDGCMFNEKYLKLNTQNRIIEANEVFIRSLSNEMLQAQYDKVIFMVGSNRQSHATDKHNAEKGGGSCFPALLQLCDEFQKRIYPVNCSVDPYLLADTYGKAPSGINFKKSILQDEHYSFSNWLFDDSKLTILYAQIHKAATDHPDAEIVYDFYDNRYLYKDILRGLADFFTTHLDLIPHNIKMRFHFYAGKDIITVATAQGIGIIDTCYHEHIYLMLQCAGISFHGNSYPSAHVLNSLVKGDSCLGQFKMQRLAHKPHRKNNSHKLFSKSKNGYFNLNIIGSDQVCVKVLYENIYSLIHHGRQWSRHVVGHWNGIAIHLRENKNNDNMFVYHAPCVKLVIAKETEDLKNTFYASRNALIYCLCIHENPNNNAIKMLADQLKIVIIKINPEDLLLRDENDELADQAVKNILNNICDDFRAVKSIQRPRSLTI